MRLAPFCVSSEAPSVEAVVLCGHWQESAIESLMPRALLPVAQRPLLAHALGWAGRAGIARATICANGGACAIAAALRAVDDSPTLTYREDLSPRGPAGCVADAAARSTADLLLVIDGSVVPALDLRRLLDTHAAARAQVSVVVQPIDPAAAEVRAAVPTGIYLFDRQVFTRVPATGFHDIKESLIPRLHRAGVRIVAHEADAPCGRVLDARTYLALNLRLIRDAVASVSGDAWSMVRPGSETGDLIHPSARVDEGAHVVGPVLVGPDAVVHAGATVVGPASIGAGVTIQPGALVSRAVLWDWSSVGTGAHVERSVLMTGTTVAPGEQVIEALRLPSRRRRVIERTAPWLPHPAAAPHGRAARLADQPS
jgi:mannose-1-phosphate guanylyltransferase